MRQHDRSIVRRSAVPMSDDGVVNLRAEPHSSARQGADRQTPATQSDGRKGWGYKILFPEVVHDLNAFWQRVFAAVGASYRAPTVTTIEAPVVTACGPG